MTALAQQVKNTPMAPYIGLMRGMSKHDIQIVVTFLNEVLEETKETSPAKSNAEIIRDKYKNLKISPKVKALVDGLSLSKEEMEDERTQHMLGL